MQAESLVSGRGQFGSTYPYVTSLQFLSDMARVRIGVERQGESWSRVHPDDNVWEHDHIYTYWTHLTELRGSHHLGMLFSKRSPVRPRGVSSLDVRLAEVGWMLDRKYAMPRDPWPLLDRNT